MTYEEKPCAVCGTLSTGRYGPVEEKWENKMPVCLDCYQNRSTDVLVKATEFEAAVECSK